jgi:hypothetical protein
MTNNNTKVVLASPIAAAPNNENFKVMAAVIPKPTASSYI